MAVSPWVKRSLANDLPSQAFRGDVSAAHVTYVNDGFDEDAEIGTQEVAQISERLTMKVVGGGKAAAIVTYERGMPVLWTVSE